MTFGGTPCDSAVLLALWDHAPMPQTNSRQQGDVHRGSWFDRVLDAVKPQPGAPHPHAPTVDSHAWNQSVDQAQVIPGLTVRDVGISVFGETRSFRDRPGSNESIAVARQKVAHAIINGRELAHKTGKKPPEVHDPIEPSRESLHNVDVRAAFESSLRAAREAYLSGHDPTNGATHLNSRPTPDRSN